MGFHTNAAPFARISLGILSGLLRRLRPIVFVLERVLPVDSMTQHTNASFDAPRLAKRSMLAERQVHREVLAQLLARAAKQGYLIEADIADALPDDAPVIEGVVAALSEMGIAVLEERPQEGGFEGDSAPPVDSEAIEEAGALLADAAAGIGASLDPLAVFTRRMQSVPLLTREDEIALAMEIEAGREALQRAAGGEAGQPADPARVRDIASAQASIARATRRMVEANLRLVLSIAKRYQHRGLDLADLVQEGNLGLLRAVEKFEYRRGFKFSTYATWWIRQAVSRAIADRARTIRVPVHVSDEANRVWRAAHRIRQRTGAKASLDELAEHTGVAVDKLRALLALPAEPLSLDTPMPEGETALVDAIEDRTGVDPFEALTANRLRECVASLLETMAPPEADVLRQRFGIGDHAPRTYDEIAQRTGVSRERIRRIEKQALDALRASPTARAAHTFIEAA